MWWRLLVLRFRERVFDILDVNYPFLDAGVSSDDFIQYLGMRTEVLATSQGCGLKSSLLARDAD
jgi:hypothetical protein